MWGRLILRRAVSGVKRAIGYCDDVEFSPEDAARTETDFLCKVVEAAIASLPEQYRAGHHPGDDPSLVRHRLVVRSDSAGAALAAGDGRSGRARQSRGRTMAR